MSTRNANSLSGRSDVAQLANTEKFFLTLSNIPRLPLRLELCLFKQQFPATIASVQENLAAVEAAMDGIEKSEGLKTIFKARSCQLLDRLLMIFETRRLCSRLATT